MVLPSGNKVNDGEGEVRFRFIMIIMNLDGASLFSKGSG